MWMRRWGGEQRAGGPGSVIYQYGSTGGTLGVDKEEGRGWGKEG